MIGLLPVLLVTGLVLFAPTPAELGRLDEMPCREFFDAPHDGEIRLLGCAVRTGYDHIGGVVRLQGRWKMASKKAEVPLAGRWRIVEMEMWDHDAIDLDVEGHFTFGKGRQGDFQFICVRGFMDCRYSGSADGPRVDFSWDGHDEDMPVSGRGWATLAGDHIEGRIFIHNGDDSSFRAQRARA